MISTSSARLPISKRSPLANLLCAPLSSVVLPPITVRFTFALLLTFFPYALMYPLPYPMGELLTLCSWTWTFPSTIGLLSLLLVPLIPSDTYGYFAFNLFCIATTLSIAVSAIRTKQLTLDTVTQLYKVARACIFFEGAICILQILTGPDVWLSVFHDMSLGAGGGRGAGLRTEPSLLAGPLTVYLILAVGRMKAASLPGETGKKHKYLFWECICVMLAYLAFTRSICVLSVTVAFLPTLMAERKRVLFAAVTAVLGGIVAVLAFGSRVLEAIADSGGSFLALITVSIGSWRNIPDIVILLNYASFLTPSGPADVRTKINLYATQLGPLFAWIQNTYSTFAAGASTLGLIAVAVLFAGGVVAAIKCKMKSLAMLLTWMLLLQYDWFLAPKYEGAGWIALGMLPMINRLIDAERVVCERTAHG